MCVRHFSVHCSSGSPRSCWRMGLAASAFAQAKTRLVVVSTLEVEHIAKFKEAFEADNPDIEIAWARDSTGVRDRAPAGGEGQPARRRDLGPRRHQHAAARPRRHPAALCARQPRRDQARFPRSARSAALGRHGGVGGGAVLQHDRGGEAEAAAPCLVVRPARPRLQGPPRDAAPGLVGHRLFPRRGVAADVRRGGGVALHGPAARQHRRLSAFRQHAVPRWLRPANTRSASPTSWPAPTPSRSAPPSTCC